MVLSLSREILMRPVRGASRILSQVIQGDQTGLAFHLGSLDFSLSQDILATKFPMKTFVAGVTEARCGPKICCEMPCAWAGAATAVCRPPPR